MNMMAGIRLIFYREVLWVRVFVVVCTSLRSLLR